MLDETARGIFTISVTPFHADGRLDLDSLDRVVDFYLEKGATGLTVLGMMGEADKLTFSESLQVVERVLARASVPVVAGVTSPGFAAMGALSRAVMDAGCAGVMIAPPSNLRSDDQIRTYYGEAASAIDGVPFVLQDFPLATGVRIPASVILKIAEDCANFVMLKHEDWPGLDKISQLRAAHAAGARRFSILCGNGGMFLPEEMARGADGAMTGFAFPEMMQMVIATIAQGQNAEAFRIFADYLPLLRYEAQPGTGLAVRKHVLMRRGAIAESAMRRPYNGLSKASMREVDQLLELLRLQRTE
ncbi:MAG: dihydrodipicolinate synthase family protein [Rhodobacteraceae bacterium]|nr:dihydrodipicolinate synthase family protein [Paracoccaceae bacterium]